MLQVTMPPISSGQMELLWWTRYLEQWNGKSLLVYQPDLVLESNASLRGWGAASQGTVTGGPWSYQERQYHINCLEILAASLAVQIFIKDRSDLTVLIMIDNTTAVSYINHLGGPVSPLATELTKQLWMWCLERNVTLKAQYLPGKENMRADRESRVMRDRSDWILNPKIFNRILAVLGPVDIDLFAS